MRGTACCCICGLRGGRWTCRGGRDDVAAVVAFWESRKPSAMRTQKLAYWTEIRDALTTGQVSDPLLARVTASW
ncbi:MAG: hypothetical protein F4025_04560 [Synechococcus sp. SB0669_bin_7]|nr:hypothetical protein [Cyanobacteria bacterium MAG IRC4_bin_6]MYK06160.1 hypothetical protein [Synechococcus sp. SB0670_bin_20]MYK85679.1 hypothetical protein [Synechococcus sp. SB0669_bin_7]